MVNVDPKPIIPVVLSGGSGTRLWPASRACYPKQFLSLAGEDSLLQTTLLRFDKEPGFAAPVVVASEEHRFVAAAQAVECGVRLGGLLVEPVARDTAPAIAAAAAWIALAEPEALMLVMPADHLIAHGEVLAETVRHASEAAEKGWLVTFGLRPVRPETGFGYIEIDDEEIAPGVRRVLAFAEKPDASTAEAYVEGGRHLWNSGLFLFRAATLLSELRDHAPDIAAAADAAVAEAGADLDFVRLGRKALEGCRGISIDYALMQESPHVAVAPLEDIGWNDIGSWQALYDVAGKDGEGNVVRGTARLPGSHGNLAYMRDGRVLVGIDICDLAVVSTPDALLVASLGSAHKIKPVLDDLRKDHPKLVEENQRMYRPWGFYETLHRGSRHQVKHICVKPGGVLSLQKHYHRAEHWVVVEGTARVTRDNDVEELTENMSVYLPLGCRHRLENPGRIPLSLIEVQSGSYLGEDDIERFEDVYGRQRA